MTTDDKSEMMTPLEVAERCGVSRRRIYDWISAGWLRSSRVGGRWLINSSDLDYFSESCRGAEGRLMPQLWEWEPLWSAKPQATGPLLPPA